MSIKRGDTVEWINKSPIYQAENGAKALVKDESRILHEMKIIRSGDRTTIEEYNADLENAMEEYRVGKFISHEDMKKEITSW